ncbi:DUF1768-domain-containing protein [Punctularia strigosozonata HHB-11173 SS5]|uniref:DUF1768-domain-containing protein n=1 Tax=Punctularia strigosozonata (strain HHB-11173) TaxID=741275 RepID=UPI00044175E8|nr:DUF1768-domain-containing protein [Punctularia strigosozonata HHB-11173 SS5]EIN08828.1 DUF1768-domain-containing protein [Punctularia strigosozonata HHB-11173 SS5]
MARRTAKQSQQASASGSTNKPAPAKQATSDPSSYPKQSGNWLKHNHLCFGGKNRQSDPNANFLSNFYPAPFELDGIQHYHVEGAFQAAKYLDLSEEGRSPTYARRIAETKDPAEAKRLGRQKRLSAEDVKTWQEGGAEAAMRKAIAAKFAQGSELAAKLLDTGDRVLVEATRDKLWGAVKGVGKNKLGVILMERRAQLAEKQREDVDARSAAQE